MTKRLILTLTLTIKIWDMPFLRQGAWLRSVAGSSSPYLPPSGPLPDQATPDTSQYDHYWQLYEDKIGRPRPQP